MTALLLAAVLAAEAAERGPPRVVLLVPAPGTAGPLARSLEAELSSLGFEVEVTALTATGAGGVLDVLEATERPNLTAVLALVSAAAGQRAIDVWVSDRATGKTVLRRLKTDGAEVQPGAEAATLAIKAVELLRASLVELSFEGRPVPAGAVATLARPPPSPPSPVLLQAGVGATFPLGSAPAVHLGVGAQLHLGVPFLELHGRLSVVPARASVPGGAVQLHEQTVLAGAGARVALSSLQLTFALLAGVTRVEAEGIAVDVTLLGRRRDNIAFSVEPAVAARWWFSPHWGLSVRVGARVDLPASVAQASGVDVVTAGLPSVAAALLLDVRP